MRSWLFTSGGSGFSPGFVDGTELSLHSSYPRVISPRLAVRNAPGKNQGGGFAFHALALLIHILRLLGGAAIVLLFLLLSPAGDGTPRESEQYSQRGRWGSPVAFQLAVVLPLLFLSVFPV